MRYQIPAPGNSITDHLHRALDQRDPLSFARAGFGVLRQGRLTELLYGMYCAATARASAVRQGRIDDLRTALAKLERRLDASFRLLDRGGLVRQFGRRYAVGGLPDDFRGCRAQAIASLGAGLVLGEYAEDSARIAVVWRDRCEVFSPYQSTPGVRHIHLLCSTGCDDEVFVTTGDATKVLDRWSIRDGAPRLVARHRSRLAGYTAAANVDGEFFFGTDFSGRPNYVETLRGEKYFFPADAFRKVVLSLTTLQQRYVVAVSADLLGVLRGVESRTISIFDSVTRSFLLATPWSELFDASAA